MPSLSGRAAKMPSSPIRRLVPFAEAAVARGRHVHHLNIGQPDIPTPKAMLDGFRSFDQQVLAYGPSEGIPALREAVSHYFHRVGDPVDPDQIHVTTGGSEALIFAFAAVADPGDEILVFEPFYANYAGFARLLGVALKPITTSASSGFHLPTDMEIVASISPRTRAILVGSPGNPTGTVYTPEEMKRIGAIAEARDLFIISDEVYREFVYGDAVFTSALSLPCAGERVIVVDSVSKRFSACGARIGFAIARNPEIVSAFRRFSFARLCPATIAQLAAVEAYKLAPSYFEPIISEYQARRDALVEGLSSISGVRTYVPEGAFYAVVTLPVEDAEVFAVWLLEEFSLDGETVMLAPGSGFYATPGLGRHEARIAYVLNRASIARAVEVIDRGLFTFLGRGG